MARKSQLNAEVAPPLEEDILPPPSVPLTDFDRSQLRTILANPSFKKAWTNAQNAVPNVFVAGTEGEGGDRIAAKQLHIIQGWTLLKIALIRQLNPPTVRRSATDESYPDSGVEIVKKPVPPAKPPEPPKKS